MTSVVGYCTFTTTRYCTLTGMLRMSLATLVAVALLLAVATGPAAAESKHVYVPRGAKVVIKPRKLGFGAHTILENLRWAGWGGSSTTSAGILDYSDATTSFRAPIHVKLSRIGTCGAKRTYLRQTITFDRASDRRQWGALDGATTLFCPV
jgi:hypothetical protein